MLHRIIFADWKWHTLFIRIKRGIKSSPYHSKWIRIHGITLKSPAKKIQQGIYYEKKQKTNKQAKNKYNSIAAKIQENWIRAWYVSIPILIGILLLLIA